LNIVMADNPTASYVPWDSYAPILFGETRLNNYVNGEQSLRDSRSQRHLIIFTCQRHSLYGVVRCKTFLLHWLMSTHQALLLYDHAITLDREVLALLRIRLPILTFKRVRSIGSGRLSRTFHPSEHGLIQSLKASMGAAKNSFHYKPLHYHLPPGVRHV